MSFFICMDPGVARSSWEDPVSVEKHICKNGPVLLQPPNKRWLPSGELTVCYGKSPCLMGKSTISMAIFHSFLLVHQAG